MLLKLDGWSYDGFKLTGELNDVYFSDGSIFVFAVEVDLFDHVVT